jgi:hypothetical protein
MRGRELQQRHHAVAECGHVAAAPGGTGSCQCGTPGVACGTGALLAGEDAGDQIAAAAHAAFVED